jgi:hypothetical protein
LHIFFFSSSAPPIVIALLLCHSDDNIDTYTLLYSTLNFKLFSKNGSCLIIVP